MTVIRKAVVLARLAMATVAAIPGAAIVLLALSLKIVGIAIKGVGEAVEEGRRPFYWLADKVAGEAEHG
ncbi:hypothetical protein [Magnetospirillum aberrantis]|uniref:Uncharacterized protein n=1 Tax=Magnetospirillum aberrantis SpK TaxID=908842 RepID=A0A7C9QT47_9PROT|nr:hypothetical protein [Magnetospirillum aberrantis]NFV80038.1 hypothetical protein [Magnetospirillum aberrantis SpK]